MNARYLFAACLLLTGAVQAEGSGAPPQARKELPFADCMRTDRINEWNVVDDRTITVRNGPNHFLIKTTVDCPRIDLGGGIRFRASESDKAVAPMRICGGINEQVVRRDDPPCQIQSVDTIDKATFDALTKKAKRHGSGAEPNGMVK
jgi:hypothetical protein